MLSRDYLLELEETASYLRQTDIISKRFHDLIISMLEEVERLEARIAELEEEVEDLRIGDWPVEY